MGFAWIYLYTYCSELGLEIQVVMLVWAKSQAEVQEWWPTKKVAEGLAVDGIILAMGFVRERCGLLRRNGFLVWFILYC